MGWQARSKGGLKVQVMDVSIFGLIVLCYYSAFVNPKNYSAGEVR